MSWDPTDLDDHFDDYVLWQAQLQQMEIDQRINEERHMDHMRKMKILREGVEINIGYSLRKLKYYMAELTPRRRSELEALLVRLNIIIPENDSRGIADLGKEYVNKTTNLEKTAVDESAEQDLEKYLSKLTSEKREELEDILNRFRKASAKLAELNRNFSNAPQKKQVTVKQAIIAWGLIISIFVICYVINHL